MNEKKNVANRQAASMARASANLAAGDFVRSVWLEMKRVTWPTRDEWVGATVLTIGLVVCLGIFTYVADQFFGFLFNFVHPF
ncbi:MAG: preprotein translocase subunit SecE [Candidatus Baltobacteraceae bacterium]